MSLGLVLAVVFTAGWIPLYFCRTEALGDAWPHYEPIEQFAAVSTIAALSLHMAAGCVLVSLEGDLAPARAAVAAGLYIAGIAFWFWGRGLIGPLALRRMPDEPPLELRRDGAFRVVRHPLYFGCLLACAAPLVAAFGRWLVVSYAVCVGLVAIRALQEERRLRAQLGREYDEYCAQVKRLVPFLW